jgi:AraC family transcriptional regulator, positive regulator of tynA and feaB
VSRVVAVVPHEMIDTRAPWLRKACRKIAPSSPFAALARRHLLQLTVGRDGLEQGEAKLLTDNLCNLLALASARDTVASARPPELQLAALLAFLRQNLGNPELSPRMVAGRFGISVRTLHLRFRSVGRTFSRFVLDSRLDGCGKALRDSRQLGCSISELAYSWGFNDLSHFNKAFRARFDMAPGEWRHSSQSTQR